MVTIVSRSKKCCYRAALLRLVLLLLLLVPVVVLVAGANIDQYKPTYVQYSSDAMRSVQAAAGWGLFGVCWTE